MAVRPIDANTLIDKWRQVQRNFKRGGENHWAELADMVIDDVSRAPTLLLVDINTVPTLTQPNEHLTCDGCISLGTSYGPCMNCIRSRLRGDMYRHPPEGGNDVS